MANPSRNLHILEIQKTLIQSVANIAFVGDKSGDETLFIEPFMNNAFFLFHQGLSDSRLKTDFTIIDFNDFLDFATTSLPIEPKFDDFPSGRIYYYDAFPGSIDSTLLSSQRGDFCPIGAAIFRLGNGIQVLLHVRNDNLNEIFKGYSEYGNELISIMYVSKKESELSQFIKSYVLPTSKLLDISPPFGQGYRDRSKIPDEEIKTQLSKFIPDLFPPSILDFVGRYGYSIAMGGDVLPGVIDSTADLAVLKEDCDESSVPDEISIINSLQESLISWDKDLFPRLNEYFEVARLMLLLPQYVKFMYDLVVREKVEIGSKNTGIKRKKRKRNKSKKTAGEVKYRIIKSINA